MPVLGITGSIATGKSTFTHSLLRRLPAELFDADQAAHALLAHEPAVRIAVTIFPAMRHASPPLSVSQSAMKWSADLGRPLAIIFAPIERPLTEIAVSARSHMSSLRATTLGGAARGSSARS